MDGFKRKTDGRRIFTVEFKRSVVGQIHSGEKTLAELSRELGIQPSVFATGSAWWTGAGRRRSRRARTWCLPAGFASFEQQVKQLQRLIGKRAMTIEILAVTQERASYGVRRTCAMVNRARRASGQKPYNL